MKNKTNLIIISISILFLSVNYSFSKSRTVTVKPGTKTAIIVHSNWDKNCNSLAPPKISIIDHPKNGVIKIKRGKETINRPRKKCNGEIVSGREIIYKSRPGFKGRDTIKYKRHYRERNDVTWTIRIRVK